MTRQNRLMVRNTATGRRHGPFTSRSNAEDWRAMEVRKWAAGAGHTTKAGARSTLLLHNGRHKGEVLIESL